MKRSVIILLAALLLSISLWGEGEESSDYAKFQAYMAEPSGESFQEANAYYLGFQDDMSGILQMYLHWEELNRLIAGFAARSDSLDLGTSFQYANLLLAIGRYEEAIPIYDRLNVESPQWSCPYRHKGEAYLKLDKLSEAEASLLKSIEVRQDHYDAYVMLAEVYNAQGRYEEALKTLEESFKYKGDHGEGSEVTEEENLEGTVEKLHQELLEKTGRN
ncbi:MAG: tetratricopeptide repeat protein [Candidatus Cloacimonetes bacterium]|nr:tetratricopeptide repeat protein [Candidatus Cloacimonadota bacterium]